ncbi:MAG: ROK family protein [Lysobacterales bacterium]|nr:MAG: ROK family protein [Xanthomonadales bacterium]
MRKPGLYGAIEAGGTKFLCAVASDVDDIVGECRIDTTTPDETLDRVSRFFRTAQDEFGELQGLGVASFGPIQLDRDAPYWGRLFATPKPGWTSASMLDALRSVANCPIELDTDVNAAALAEALLGAGRGCDDVVYVTVGTGIGAGAVINGQTVRGRLHPEMGHLQIRRDERDMNFAGVCPFHGDCLEGLASGGAIERRWRTELTALPAEHAAYSIIGGYLGRLAATIALVVSPECIAFGGGVLTNGLLLPHIRAAMRDVLAGYLPAQAGRAAEEVVCASTLQGRAGLLGALLLARRASKPPRPSPSHEYWLA